MNWQQRVSPRSELSDLGRTSGAAHTRMVTIAAGVTLILFLSALYAFNAHREARSKTALQANRGGAVAVTTESVQSAPMAQLAAAIGSLSAVHQVTVSSELAG